MASEARAWVVSLIELVVFVGPSEAAIIFSDLGTGNPPATVGTVPVSAFNTAPQAALPDLTLTSTIPGNPLGGPLILSIQAKKETIGVSWATWSHGYTG